MESKESVNEHSGGTPYSAATPCSPCPFCGQECHVTARNAIQNDLRTAYFVGCRTTLCRGNATTGSFDLDDEIRRWNQRPACRETGEQPRSAGAAWKAAIEVLRETDNPAVMWGDEGLLHMIAKRLGWKAEAWRTSDRVMAALNRTPGHLVKEKTQLPNGRIVSIFRLPEFAR